MNPSRLMLGLFLGLWLDSRGRDREFIQAWIESVWIKPSRVKWTDEDDPPLKVSQSNEEKQAGNQLKSLFASVLEETRNAPVQS